MTEYASNQPEWHISASYDEDGKLDEIDLPLTGNAGNSAFASLEMMDSDFASLHLFRNGEHALVEICAELDDGLPILNITIAERWED